MRDLTFAQRHSVLATAGAVRRTFNALITGRFEGRGQDVYNLSRRAPWPRESGTGAKCGDLRDNDGVAGGAIRVHPDSWQLPAYIAAPTQTFVQDREASARMISAKG